MNYDRHCEGEAWSNPCFELWILNYELWIMNFGFCTLHLVPFTLNYMLPGFFFVFFITFYEIITGGPYYKKSYRNRLPLLSECQSRIYLGVEAQSLGWVGITKIHRLTSPYDGRSWKPLMWCSKSIRKIQEVLRGHGYQISHESIRKYLIWNSYFLTAPKFEGQYEK